MQVSEVAVSWGPRDRSRHTRTSSCRGYSAREYPSVCQKESDRINDKLESRFLCIKGFLCSLPREAASLHTNNMSIGAAQKTSDPHVSTSVKSVGARDFCSPFQYNCGDSWLLLLLGTGIGSIRINFAPVAPFEICPTMKLLLGL